MARLSIWIGVLIGMLGAGAFLVYPWLKAMAVGVGKNGWETRFWVVSCLMVVLGATLTFWVPRLIDGRSRRERRRRREARSEGN
jgi:predicted MFS family arabinose efflux permease